MNLFSPCFLIGHVEPMKVLHGKALHFECARCGSDLGEVLKGQRFRERKVPKPKKAKRKSAEVLTLKRRVG